MTEIALTVEQFDATSMTAMGAAQQAARELNHGFIGTEHLLLGAAQTVSAVASTLGAHIDFPDGYTNKLRDLLAGHPEWRRHVPRREALAAIGVDLDEVRERTTEQFGPDAAPHEDFGPAFTPRAADVLRLAANTAASEHRTATAVDIAVAALSDADGYASIAVRELGADPDIVNAEIRRL
jgi:ATP-dependent Clp protease ATP-binding subunit ClpA